MHASKKMDLVYKVLKQSPVLTSIDLAHVYGFNDSGEELFEIYKDLSEQNQNLLIGYAKKVLEAEKSQANS